MHQRSETVRERIRTRNLRERQMNSCTFDFKLVIFPLVSHNCGYKISLTVRMDKAGTASFRQSPRKPFRFVHLKSEQEIAFTLITSFVYFLHVPQHLLIISFHNIFFIIQPIEGVASLTRVSELSRDTEDEVAKHIEPVGLGIKVGAAEKLDILTSKV